MSAGRAASGGQGRLAAHMPSDLGEKLVDAARTTDLALLKRLLKSKSVDVDYVDAKGVTALRLACINGQASAVESASEGGRHRNWKSAGTASLRCTWPARRIEWSAWSC